MNEFDLLCKQNKTVDEIKLPTWNKLIEILDLSPDNDWENIGKYFFFSKTIISFRCELDFKFLSNLRILIHCFLIHFNGKTVPQHFDARQS